MSACPESCSHQQAKSCSRETVPHNSKTRHRLSYPFKYYLWLCHKQYNSLWYQFKTENVDVELGVISRPWNRNVAALLGMSQAVSTTRHTVTQPLCFEWISTQQNARQFQLETYFDYILQTYSALSQRKSCTALWKEICLHCRKHPTVVPV